MNTLRTLLIASAVAFTCSATTFAADAIAVDHAALAQSYETQAAAATQKAAAHEAMARAYRTGGTPKSNGAAMNDHCTKLVAGYRAEATEYQAKAATEWQLASTTK